MTGAILVQMEWDKISAIAIRGEWMDVASIVCCDLQLGRIRENPAQTCFWADFNAGVWIRIETPENHFVYYPVNEITGFEADGPSGG